MKDLPALAPYDHVHLAFYWQYRRFLFAIFQEFVTLRTSSSIYQDNPRMRYELAGQNYLYLHLFEAPAALLLVCFAVMISETAMREYLGPESCEELLN